MNLIIVLVISQLLIISCLKEENFVYKNIAHKSISYKGINLNQNTYGACNQEIYSEECLEKFPQIKGPFTSVEKTKAILIISEQFCLSNKKKSGDNIKEKVLKKFVEENIDLELINSYEVIKTAYKMSNASENSCNFEKYKNQKFIKTP